MALEVKSGTSGRISGMKVFQSRHKNVQAIQIGGDGSDLPLEQFFDKGI
jgi:hypothetical protein